MSFEFDKLSNEDLEKLKKEAEANLRLMSDARSLKERSAQILTDFQAAIAALERMKVLVEKTYETSSYNNNKSEARVFTLKGATDSSVLGAAFSALLKYRFSSSDLKHPFGLVPVKEFWAEWSSVVLRMTICMVNKYMKHYVTPYPTEPAEAVKAFKIGEVIADAAASPPEEEIPF